MKKTKSLCVFITGVSSGIGLGTAKAFLAHGYQVFGSVRKKQDADRLAATLGREFQPFLFDVTDATAIARAAETVSSELKGKGLGGLINNAGIGIGGPLMYQPLSEIRAHFDVNVVGLVAVTQAFLPLLGARADHSSSPGKIINISSIGGKLAVPFLGAYSGSKFAVEGVSHTLRRELLLYGIDVIVIGPGAVATPIWDKSGDTSVYKQTDYFKSLNGFKDYFIAEGKKGFSIDEFGEKVFHIFEVRKPKTRYALVPHAFRNWTLPRLMPDRVTDRIIARRLGFIK
jgi:NAD(P)-dependent dehydrogenase (short-subunit alcohol dehydrogenase family)